MKNHKYLPFLFSIISLCKIGINPSLAAEVQPSVNWGAFIDSYYAYDFNRPVLMDRAYTTQPARHNEFNINLAYIEAKLDREKVHGRLALQAGTSVQNNYSSEPTVGSISGPSLARNIQEGYAGYRLGKSTWIDAGIMLSHIGLESFISKDNLTYTRSLVADYSPYYETGVRLSTQFNDQLSGQLLILNGWQNISESNSNKAFGTQLSYSPSSSLTLIYNTFFGRESSYRHFHDLIVKYTPNDLWSYAIQADLGYQSESALGKNASWNGFTFISKRQITKNLGVVGRIEHYSDLDQVLITTPSGLSFTTWSSSIGVDTLLETNVWWRNELRGYWSKDAIFTNQSGNNKNDAVIVSSISASF